MSVGLFIGEFEGLEDESDLVLSVDVCGGWLVGWLEVVIMTLCRSWADTAELKPTLTKNANTDRYEILFKLFKTYTPKFGFLWEGMDEDLTQIKTQLHRK